MFVLDGLDVHTVVAVDMYLSILARVLPALKFCLLFSVSQSVGKQSEAQRL
jgi:hypothetical protein